MHTDILGLGFGGFLLGMESREKNFQHADYCLGLRVSGFLVVSRGVVKKMDTAIVCGVVS